MFTMQVKQRCSFLVFFSSFFFFFGELYVLALRLFLFSTLIFFLIFFETKD